MVRYVASCLCMDTLLLHYSHIFFMQEPRLILYIPLPYFTNTVPFPASKLILLLILLQAILLALLLALLLAILLAILLALLLTTTAAVLAKPGKRDGSLPGLLEDEPLETIHMGRLSDVDLTTQRTENIDVSLNKTFHLFFPLKGQLPVFRRIRRAHRSFEGIALNSWTFLDTSLQNVFPDCMSFLSSSSEMRTERCMI